MTALESKIRFDSLPYSEQRNELLTMLRNWDTQDLIDELHGYSYELEDRKEICSKGAEMFRELTGV